MGITSLADKAAVPCAATSVNTESAGRFFWSPEQDAALAFGAALGMSAKQIAASFGNGMTRNAIIGRCHRVGLSLNGKRPKHTKVEAAKKRTAGSHLRLWTDEENDTLSKNYLLPTAELMKLLPGRSQSAIDARRIERGLRRRNVRWFSPEQDEILRREYLASTPIDVIAPMVGHSIGTTRQRVLRLGLRRDARKTSLVRRWGLDALTASADPVEARKILLERERQARESEKAAREIQIEAALDEMVALLKQGCDRRTAFRAAMLDGATLTQIGARCGITYERVRQIVNSESKRGEKVMAVAVRDFSTGSAVLDNVKRVRSYWQNLAGKPQPIETPKVEAEPVPAPDQNEPLVVVMHGRIGKLVPASSVTLKNHDWLLPATTTVKRGDGMPTVDDIQRAVCKHFGIPMIELKSERRTKEVVLPRHIAMWLAKTETINSLPSIGRQFGGRDHTTVLHAFRRIEALRQTDEGMRQTISLIRLALGIAPTNSDPAIPAG